jgi:phage FluMu protein Com
MRTVTQIQIRCAGCNRRLADLVNEVQAGEALLEFKCPRCGLPHLEVVRCRADSGEIKTVNDHDGTVTEMSTARDFAATSTRDPGKPSNAVRWKG